MVDDSGVGQIQVKYFQSPMEIVDGQWVDGQASGDSAKCF
jgi:hypothetical protein